MPDSPKRRLSTKWHGDRLQGPNPNRKASLLLIPTSAPSMATTISEGLPEKDLQVLLMNPIATEIQITTLRKADSTMT